MRMSPTQKKRLLALSLVAALIVAAVVGTLFWKAESAPKYLRLADGTEAFYLGDSKVTPAARYPKPREIHVDGDAFLRVAESPDSLTVRSRLLVLTVTGKTAFRMTAYSKEAGEQVEVLYGNITAHKNYESSYKEPDVLTGGQMTMINRDIDLMEKETTDIAQLRAWSDALIASIAKQKH
jgi:hypothetical protein